MSKDIDRKTNEANKARLNPHTYSRLAMDAVVREVSAEQAKAERVQPKTDTAER